MNVPDIDDFLFKFSSYDSPSWTSYIWIFVAFGIIILILIFMIWKNSGSGDKKSKQ